LNNVFIYIFKFTWYRWICTSKTYRAHCHIVWTTNKPTLYM